MGFAHDLRRATAKLRREQARRNREASEEAAARANAAGVEVGPLFQGDAKMVRVGAPENKMVRTEAPENKAEPEEAAANDLTSVPFASDQAALLANAAGLGARDFAGRPYSGRAGFNAGDVRGLIEELGR